jgi:hypothetical protein
MHISLWRFLFPIFQSAAQPKEFFLDGLKKSEKKATSVWSSGGICGVNKIFKPIACCFLYKDLSAPPPLKVTNVSEEHVASFFRVEE